MSQILQLKILLEYTWKIPPIGKGQAIRGHLTWSNGDTTGRMSRSESQQWVLTYRVFLSGYGTHADFTNG